MKNTMEFNCQDSVYSDWLDSPCYIVAHSMCRGLILPVDSLGAYNEHWKCSMLDEGHGFLEVTLQVVISLAKRQTSR
jgi:hypothetical protein